MFKKITISAVVALPFPFLIILAGSRLDVFASEKSAIEFLKTDNGIAFYAAAFFMFLVRLRLGMEKWNEVGVIEVLGFVGRRWLVALTCE